MPNQTKNLSEQSPSSSSTAGKQRSNKSGENHSPATVPWTFLTNHAHVLIVLHSQPDLVLREVASRVGITERAVQRIVHELEEEGYLIRERIGRRNHYQIISDKHLRHPVESHCTIDQILELISRTIAAGKRRG